MPQSEIEIRIGSRRRHTTQIVAKQRPERRPRLDPLIPGFYQGIIRPRNIAEIVNHRKMRRGRQIKVALRASSLDEAGEGSASGLVRAPMHAKVLALLVANGAAVMRGQRLAIVEAMKMEHTLVAPMDGIVAEIAVAVDAQVAEGAKVMVIEAA